MSQEHWLKGVDSVAIWPPLSWHLRVVKYRRPRKVFSPVLRPDAAVVLDEAEDDGNRCWKQLLRKTRQRA